MTKENPDALLERSALRQVGESIALLLPDIDALRRYQTNWEELSKSLELHAKPYRELFRRITESVAQAEALQARLTNSPTLHGIDAASRRLAEQMSAFDEVAKAFSSQHLDSLRGVEEQLAQIAAVSARVAASFESIDVTTLSNALQQQFKYLGPQVDQEFGASQVNSEKASVLDFIVVWVHDTVSATGISLDHNTVLLLIVTIILHFHALQSSNADFDELGDRLEEALASRPTVSEVIEPKLRFAALDRLNLRSEPSDSAQVIVTMNPNQIVELIRESGNWTMFVMRTTLLIYRGVVGLIVIT